MARRAYVASFVHTCVMAIVRLNPEKLHATAGYAHVTLVDAGRLAVLAGSARWTTAETSSAVATFSARSIRLPLMSPRLWRPRGPAPTTSFDR